MADGNAAATAGWSKPRPGDDKKRGGPGGHGHEPIIIKKKKHGEHGHHGGAWKVAYADFVTAMMAFFLLLWLLNVTTDEQKKGISQYFTPESVSRSLVGSGGILGGQSLSSESVSARTGAITTLPQTANAPTPPAVEEDDPEEDDPIDPPVQVDRRPPSPPIEETVQVTEEDVRKAMAQKEEQEFAKAQEDLQKAIDSVPEFKGLAQNLLIDRTPEGLRIQLVDQERTSMFSTGSAAPLDHTRQLLSLVTRIVTLLPNRISITGHTDSTPYTSRQGYSNWELSSDRANASRRAMLEAGLPAERVSRVVGRAEQEALLPQAPTDPRNRRISIVLLRENAAGAASSP